MENNTDDSIAYLLSWDCTGLEAVVNLTEIDQQITWEALTYKGDGEFKSRSPTVSSIVNHIVLRARFNTQRHYEVYTVNCSPEITAQMLKNQFEENPQGMADLIRERGHKIYSDRATTKRVIE